jgi:hypothetical protein
MKQSMARVLGGLALLGAVATSGAAHADPSGYVGTWSGSLSGSAFTLVIWNTGSDPHATISFGSTTETLQILGKKAGQGVEYFYRAGDAAPISIYVQGSQTRLGYFEKDGVRNLDLTLVP